MRRRSSTSAREPEGAGIIAWRRSRLRRAGFTDRLAEALANDRRTDLHAMLELVDRGCPPELAARILAPLDDPPAGAA
jgi:hypothetical protein